MRVSLLTVLTELGRLSRRRLGEWKVKSHSKQKPFESWRVQGKHKKEKREEKEKKRKKKKKVKYRRRRWWKTCIGRIVSLSTTRM